ncbi:MAG: hypothetical protein GY909_18860 [Oligoflexia bacterium]|nr:hypothetical protein [Oligoflexia bacterium]
MNKVIFLIATLLTTSVFASTAKFNIEMELVDLSTEEVIFSYHCNVRQTLTWESQLNFFNCENEEGEKLNISKVVTDVGYDYDRRQAFSLWHLSHREGLVTKIFKEINIEAKLKSSNPAKIFYGRRAPSVTASEFLIDSEETTYAFKLETIGYL